MRARSLAAAGACALAAAAPAAAGAITGGATAAPSPLSKPVGTVVRVSPLPRNLWIPGTVEMAYRLTYVTTDVHGEKALSTGEVFVPPGAAPAGGWPLISWAHGTSGLGDSCAPSVIGPAEPQRDLPYLSRWMHQGYAVVASDYAGLGTPGVPAYLNGLSEAHNVVDMVKAGRAFASQHLLADQQFSNRWVVVGQSQGGGAAIYTARWATQFGGRDLDYLGAVGTGVPANVEVLLSTLGPGVPPAPTGGHLETYVALIVAALRADEPQLRIDSALTPYGAKYANLALTECAIPMTRDLANVTIGDFFSKPLRSLPNWTPTIDAYMKMPTTGFDKPFFMGHGVLDTDVPYAATAPYVAQLIANNQPVTFKTYVADHSGTLIASQKDAIPFLKALFDAAGTGPTPTVATRLRLLGHPTLHSALRSGLRVAVVTNAGSRITVTGRFDRHTVASGHGTTTSTGQTLIRVRFSRTARVSLARARRVTIRLSGAGASLTIHLR